MENSTLIDWGAEAERALEPHEPVVWDDLIDTIMPILSGDPAPTSADAARMRPAIVWDDVVAAVLPILPGDAEFVESDGAAQFGHFASGIRITLRDDELLMSSSYSLLGGAASIVADQLRDVVLAVEMVTGRAAQAVHFDQPDLAAGDIAGRERVHGYAMTATAQQEAARASLTMALHPSLLLGFDAHVERRNP